MWLAPGNTMIMSFTWLQGLLPHVPGSHTAQHSHALTWYSPQGTLERAPRHRNPSGQSNVMDSSDLLPNTCSSPKSQWSGSERDTSRCWLFYHAPRGKLGSQKDPQTPFQMTDISGVTWGKWFSSLSIFQVKAPHSYL